MQSREVLLLLEMNICDMFLVQKEKEKEKEKHTRKNMLQQLSLRRALIAIFTRAGDEVRHPIFLHPSNTSFELLVLNQKNLNDRIKVLVPVIGIQINAYIKYFLKIICPL